MSAQTGRRYVASGRREPWAVSAARRMFQWLAKAYFHLEVEGLERIPAQGPAIIAGNHASVLDGILLQAISPRPVRFLIAEDMFNHPILKPLFKAFGCIEVYRTKTQNGDALRAAVSALEQGDVIGIFPEGTIHLGGRMERMKPGVALLAMRTGAPVVPLAIIGAGEAFPGDAKVPRSLPIRMRFGNSSTYPVVRDERVPEDRLQAVLGHIRERVLFLRDHMPTIQAYGDRPFATSTVRTAAAALILLPLSRCLTLTARPSLDPVRR